MNTKASIPQGNVSATQVGAVMIICSNLLFPAIGWAIMHSPIPLIEQAFTHDPADETIVRVIGWLMPVQAVIMVLISFLVRRFGRNLLRSFNPTGYAGKIRTAYASMAICISGSTYALVWLLMSDTYMMPIVAVIIATVGCAFHFPTKAWLEADS